MKKGRDQIIEFNIKYKLKIAYKVYKSIPTLCNMFKCIIILYIPLGLVGLVEVACIANFISFLLSWFYMCIGRYFIYGGYSLFKYTL